ncbi:MAG TPA: hypothetical protein GXX19_09375 [Syntrophomonadaceae bacterium]|nr:hypothetical protein [Syntrophomonadaceae bacterium]
MLKKRLIFTVLVLTLVAVTAGCGSSHKSVQTKHSNDQSAPIQQSTAANKEQPLAPEKNPVGDIPDSQVFVKYISNQGGYELKVPEGWARKIRGSDASFTDKFDGIEVKISQSAKAPSPESVKVDQAATLQKTGRAVEIKSISEVTLNGGSAVLIKFNSNSEPEQVTGKQVRLDNEEFLFYKNGKIAALRLWAPLGADNVDQWKLISNSFRWL